MNFYGLSNLSSLSDVNTSFLIGEPANLWLLFGLGTYIFRLSSNLSAKFGFTGAKGSVSTKVNSDTLVFLTGVDGLSKLSKSHCLRLNNLIF